MVDKKILKVISIILIIIFLLLSGAFVYNKIKYSSYKEVEAKIISVDSRYGTATNPDSRTHYVTYKYMAEGREYTAKRQVFTKTGKKEGKTEKIRYNPENPSEIENTMADAALAGMILFTGVFTVLLWIIIIKRK